MPRADITRDVSRPHISVLHPGTVAWGRISAVAGVCWSVSIEGVTPQKGLSVRHREETNSGFTKVK